MNLKGVENVAVMGTYLLRRDNWFAETYSYSPSSTLCFDLQPILVFQVNSDHEAGFPFIYIGRDLHLENKKV